MATSSSEIKIPTIWPVYPIPQHDYPITPRENILLAIEHKKPKWMPVFNSSANITPPDGFGDMPADMFADSIDWFGTTYKMSEAQGSNTPVPGMFSEIGEWRSKINWPDFDAWDWKKGYEGYRPDPSLATVAWFGNGLFERMHIFEGFENALVDLISDPDECRAYFERMADYRIEAFKHLNDIYHFDFIVYNDDWGTVNGPFFSVDLFEQTLLEPTKRLVKGMQAEGSKVNFHNCGKVEAFMPYLVEEIGADALQIQSNINDIKALMQKYGDRVSFDYYLDNYRMFDTDTTPEDARAYARELVEEFGAQSNPGSGVMIIGSAHSAEVYAAFEEEIYQYSLAKYGEE
jgi:hypothetical protein